MLCLVAKTQVNALATWLGCPMPRKQYDSDCHLQNCESPVSEVMTADVAASDSNLIPNNFV